MALQRQCRVLGVTGGPVGLEMGYRDANHSILECILGCPLWETIRVGDIYRQVQDVLLENVMLKGYKEFRMRCFATSCDEAALNDNRC